MTEKTYNLTDKEAYVHLWHSNLMQRRMEAGLVNHVTITTEDGKTGNAIGADFFDHFDLYDKVHLGFYKTSTLTVKSKNKLAEEPAHALQRHKVNDNSTED